MCWWRGGAEAEATVSRHWGTLPLLEGVLDAVPLPVLAAGGISTARGARRVLAAGAAGAWLGTAFAACSDSLATDAPAAPSFGGRTAPIP